jgi:hypothetical protein
MPMYLAYSEYSHKLDLGSKCDVSADNKSISVMGGSNVEARFAYLM